MKGGLSFPVSLRHYGDQDKGVSPQGAQDQLSFLTAYKLLDKPNQFQAIEMIYPSKVTANEDLLVVITGASYESTKIDQLNITNNQVFKICRDQAIEFIGIKKGFRSIVLAIPFESDVEHLVGSTRSKELDEFITSSYRDSSIRVVKGPEYNILKDTTFFDSIWSISANSSQMGISLDGSNLDTHKVEMISQPVADGTIQLAPSGPIVLMRHRQTVGGYPRIANVLEADISKLAQLIPGSRVRFREVDLQEAIMEKVKLAKIFS